MNIINIEAIPVAVRQEALLNLLAYWPNEDPDKSNLDHLNEKFWDIAKRINEKGHKIRQEAAAGEPVNIKPE
jgi:hypothetical protein